MQVEIWSDVACPFCYIGKRKFEAAWERFPHRDEVKVAWKSFQLAPEAVTDPDRHINEYLADRKGWSLEQARQANERVARMAAEVGLAYDFDKVVVANTFDAHRLIQLARTLERDADMEENLFRAYFTEGGNVADPATLLALGRAAGLPEADVGRVLGGEEFAEAVRRDIREARQLGIQGVPFFALDRRYGVAGAQDSGVILQALEQAYAEWKEAT